MLIIGIDPGISGSICFLLDGKILEVIEMPTMTEGKKNKRQQSNIFGTWLVSVWMLDPSSKSWSWCWSTALGALFDLRGCR